MRSLSILGSWKKCQAPDQRKIPEMKKLTPVFMLWDPGMHVRSSPPGGKMPIVFRIGTTVFLVFIKFRLPHLSVAKHLRTNKMRLCWPKINRANTFPDSQPWENGQLPPGSGLSSHMGHSWGQGAHDEPDTSRSPVQ